MTAFTVPRGQFRALLAALAPHTGTESDSTPSLGRARFTPGAEHLLGWATDHLTTVAARIDVVDHHDGEADTFDLPVAALRAALAVFKAPSGTDAKMMWDDQDLLVRVTDEHVVLTEVGHIVDGRSLQVHRIVPATGADPYPDVPREVADTVTGARARDVDPHTRVNADLLARFQTAGRAWDSPVHLDLIADPSAVVVRVGDRLIGTLPAYAPNVDEPDRTRLVVSGWLNELEPLRRPVPVEVPADVVDDLRSQAADFLRHGTGVHLTVVKAGDPS